VPERYVERTSVSFMANWVINTIESTGYFGIVFLMFLENVFPPIPSEVILPLAGFMVAKGKLNLVGVIIAGTVGSVLGTLPLYFVGYFVREDRLKAFADNHGRWLTLSRGDIERAKKWFGRYGWLAVLICRMIPAVRSLISIPAGIAKMNLLAFLCYSAVGASLWSALLAYAGYILEARFKMVGEYLDLVLYTILAVIVLLYFMRLFRARPVRKSRSG
jgi:membrane protein DedA with SNARE-associated domain